MFYTFQERKNLVERIVAENQLRDEMETALTDGKSKMQNMAEGLAQESKKSLRMEAAMEKQNSKFDAEREVLRSRLQEEEKQTSILRTEVGRLSKQLESLQQQVRNSGSSPSNIHIRSTVSPVRASSPSVPGRNGPAGGVVSQSSGSTLQPGSLNLDSNSQAYNPLSASAAAATGVRPAAGQHQTQGNAARTYIHTGPRVTDGGRIGSNSPEREVIYKPESPSIAGNVIRRQTPVGVRQGLTSAPGVDHMDVDPSSGVRIVSVAPELSASVSTHGGSKVVVHVGGSAHVTTSSQMRKSPAFGTAPASGFGRGTPPPIPPNKPNFISPGPASGKPSLPPKVSVVGSGVLVQPPGKDMYSGQYSQPLAKTTAQQTTSAVQIPVSVVGGPSPPVPGGAVVSVRTQVRETSPSSVKKAPQVCVNAK